jgi:hypothetical protein
MARFIKVAGPTREGVFLATSPDGDTSILLYREDLEALKVYWDVEHAQGDLINLSRRTRVEMPDRGSVDRG